MVEKKLPDNIDLQARIAMFVFGLIEIGIGWLLIHFAYEAGGTVFVFFGGMLAVFSFIPSGDDLDEEDRHP